MILSQITDSSAGASIAPSLDGGSVAFASSADLLGTNGDGNFEIYLCSLPAGPAAVAVPAATSTGLVVFTLLLSLAGVAFLTSTR